MTARKESEGIFIRRKIIILKVNQNINLHLSFQVAEWQTFQNAY